MLNKQIMVSDSNATGSQSTDLFLAEIKKYEILKLGIVIPHESPLISVLPFTLHYFLWYKFWSM
jgi:hypothetical protein